MMSTKSEPKSKQVQIRLTESGRNLLERLAAKHKVSMSDVMSKALNALEEAPGALIIHDHFDGSARCAECKGHCRLKRDDLAVTQIVRNLMELFTVGGWREAPVQFRWALTTLLGAKRYQTMWKRAMGATEPARRKR